MGWLACGLAVHTASWLLIRRARAGLCPASSFLDGVSRTDWLLLYVPAFFAAGAAGFLLVTVAFLVVDIPAANWAATGGRWRPVGRVLATRAVLLAGSVAVAAPLCLNTLYAGACAGPDGLGQRTGGLGSLRTYGWDQVSGVSVECARGKGKPTPYLTFMMDDGALLEFNLGPDAAAGYRDLRGPLHGRRFAFDNSGSVRCWRDDAATFAQPPGM